MHSDTWEVALSKQLVELRGAKGALHENNHLVELERIQQVVKLAILLSLGESNVVLLEAM